MLKERERVEKVRKISDQHVFTSTAYSIHYCTHTLHKKNSKQIFMTSRHPHTTYSF